MQLGGKIKTHGQPEMKIVTIINLKKIKEGSDEKHHFP
jgi:hypothetical protein